MTKMLIIEFCKHHTISDVFGQARYLENNLYRVVADKNLDVDFYFTIL